MVPAGQEVRRFDTSLMPGSQPTVQQQPNFSDCGIYLLQYIESFFRDPIGDYNLPIKSIRNWFPKDEVEGKMRRKQALEQYDREQEMSKLEKQKEKARQREVERRNAELKEKQAKHDLLDDASNEIILADDDEPIRCASTDWRRDRKSVV